MGCVTFETYCREGHKNLDPILISLRRRDQKLPNLPINLILLNLLIFLLRRKRSPGSRIRILRPIFDDLHNVAQLVEAEAFHLLA